MDTEVVELALPDGTSLLVRATRVGEPGHKGPSELFSFTYVTRTVRGLATELHKALQTASPDRVTVELGFDLAIKGSQIVALVADGGMHGSIKVQLEWNGDAARNASDQSSALQAEDNAENS